MATLTNKVAASALNGEGVQVSLDSGTRSTDKTTLAALTIGAEVTCVSSSKKGIIVSVDLAGTTFIVAPNNQAARFDSTTTPGILKVDETITY
jgi:hypothetical protein